MTFLDGVFWVAVGLGVVFLALLVYFPLTRRRHEHLIGTACYHLRRADSTYAIGPENCQPRSRALMVHRPWRRHPAGYLFSRVPGRFALFNSTNLRKKSGPIYVHVLPPGALAGHARHRMAYRPWDGAVALLDAYTGPVSVEEFATVTAWRASLAEDS